MKKTELIKKSSAQNEVPKFTSCRALCMLKKKKISCEKVQFAMKKEHNYKDMHKKINFPLLGHQFPARRHFVSTKNGLKQMWK